MGVTAKGSGAAAWGNKNVLKWIVMCAHWNVHFKWVNCMVCELYCNKAVLKKSTKNYTNSGEGVRTHKSAKGDLKFKKIAPKNNSYNLS